MKTLQVLVFVGIMVFIAYLSGVGIPYFADDLLFVFESPATKITYYWTHANPFHFYRPIEATFLALVQTYFGQNTAPIHITLICLHILLCWLIYSFTVSLGFSNTQAAIASLFMALSQANVMAVLGNDSVSQVAGTLFGYLSVYLLYRFYYKSGPVDNGDPSYGTYLLSVVAFFLALLSKESSTSFALLVLGVICLKHFQDGFQPSRILNAFIHASPFLLSAIVYLVIRSAVGGFAPRAITGRYGFHLGLNIVENLARLLSVSVLPVSSVTLYAALARVDYVTIALILLVTSSFLGLLVSGLWIARQPGLVMLLATGAVICCFPMAMLNHVSELYAYNSMPFVSMIIGIGLGRYLERTQARLKMRWLVLMMVILVFANQIAAIKSKAMLMKKNGERARILSKQVTTYVTKVPDGGELLLVNPPKQEVEYSVFLMNGFNVLKGGTPNFPRWSQRNDVKVKVIEPDELSEMVRTDRSLIVSFNDDDLKPAPQPLRYEKADPPY